MKKIREFIVGHPIITIITMYFVIFTIGVYNNNMRLPYLVLGTFLGVGILPIMQIIQTDKKGNIEKTWVYLFIIVATILGILKVGDLINPPINIQKEGVSCDIDPELSFILHEKWKCEGDCKGHETGYKWACENLNEAIRYNCGGNSKSFQQGCEGFKKMYLSK